MVILDRSSDVTAAQLELSRLAAKTAINQLLREEDRVGLVVLDSHGGATVLDPLIWEACLLGRLVPATQR